MKYKHLFFDLDRTLWHFERNSQEALEEIVKEQKLHEYGVTDVHSFINEYRKINEMCWSLYRKGEMPKEELRITRFERTLMHHGIDNVQIAEQMADSYVAISPTKTQLCDGTIPALEYLQSKGYIMHIITNGFEEVQFIKIENSGLAPYFDEVIISERVGFKKPHPKVFEFALNTSGARREESVVIGDDLQADVIGARGAGIDQVFYNPHRTIHKESVTHEIAHLDELHAIL